MRFNIRHILSDSSVVRPLAYQIISWDRLNRNPLYRHLYSSRIINIQNNRVKYPKTVAIEGTNKCNSACIMCGHRNMERCKGVMSMKMYELIIEQLQHWPIKSLLLSGFGEPLLDPYIEDRIIMAKSKGFRNIGIVSNALLLTPEKADKLIAAGLDLMHISLDGATPETYQRLRPGLDYRIVVENINHILLRSPRLKVNIQVVALKDNVKEVTTLRRLWEHKADRLIFRQAQDWAGQVTIPNKAYSPHFKKRKFWPPCLYLWDQLSIYWDGTMPACHLDYEAKQIIGNVNRQNITDIWEGSVLKDLRQKHNAGQRDQIPLCRQCRYFSVWW